MTIRNRLTIQFTTLVAIILLLVLSSIYIATKLIEKKQFYDRLKERADIAAQIYLEEDELSKNSYELVQQKFFKKLPGEIIQIFNSQNDKQFIADNSKTIYSDKLLDEVRKKKVVSLTQGENQIVGTYYTDNQGDFVIFVSAADDAGEIRLKELLLLMAISYIVALVVIYFSGRYFSKKALELVPDVIEQVNRITASNLHLRVDEGKNKDEIAELASTFNGMLNRLESSFEMQKIFVSNASHELRTPLTSMIGELEVFLSKQRNNDEYKESLNSVLGDAQKMNELTSGLLNIAQIDFEQNEIRFEEIRIDELIVEIENEMLSQNPQSKILLEFINLPEDSSKLIVKGNKQLLSAVFTNLFHNAIKFSNNQPVICRFVLADDGVQISIIDKGIGISEDEINKIFQPFYRSDHARAFPGHGIGLALVEKILKLHHFRISVESPTSEGTSVTVYFKF